MRITLKGINSITKRLADGTPRTYWYAWKGGPPLRGEPGTPEYEKREMPSAINRLSDETPSLINGA
jgi:hypothetical protein